MRFYPNLKKFSWKSEKGQSWNTAVQKSASGKVVTNTQQFLPAWTVVAKYETLTDEETRELLGFVALCKGASEPFWWLDPEDHEAKDQVLAPLGDNRYQAVMKQGDYVEAVGYIDNVKVYVNGIERTSGFSVSDGIITFNSAVTGEVTADYRYYWKMMFVDDGINTNKIFKNINEVTIKMEVVR